MGVILPEMKPVPKGATKEDRKKMYDAYVAELKELNPWYVQGNPMKSYWNQLKGLFS